MKVKKQSNKKNVLGIKELRVNLTRLTKERINKLLNDPAKENVINYNFSLKFKDNKWQCTNHPSSIAPIISSGGNILISLRKTVTSANQNTVHISSMTPAYNLRQRSDKKPTEIKATKKPKPTTISELSVTLQKKRLWAACKQEVQKSALILNAIVFAKQNGFAPWPSRIIKINKSGKSAIVKYFGFVNYVGSVKMSEIVQLDSQSMNPIGALISFTLKTKAIKEFGQFEKAIKEIQGAMKH